MSFADVFVLLVLAVGDFALFSHLRGRRQYQERSDRMQRNLRLVVLRGIR